MTKDLEKISRQIKEEIKTEMYARLNADKKLLADIKRVQTQLNTSSLDIRQGFEEAYTRSKEYTDVTAITHNKRMLDLQTQLETLKNKKNAIQKIKEWITSILKIKITITKGK